MEFDVCIIGGGAAGLMAGVFAGQKGASVVIIESNTTAGRKLLKTGGGRCNITHSGDINHFVQVYGDCGRFLKHSLYEFPAEKVCDFFADNGLQTKLEKDGCVFPVTDRAADVMHVLLDVSRRSGAEFLYGKTVETVEKIRDGFVIVASGKRVTAKAVIIATGGVSWPNTGSSGDGYEFAEKFGNTIVPPKAACVALVGDKRGLQGVAVGRVCLRAVVEDKKFRAEGPLVFTDNGVGGPAVFDISRLITDYLHGTGREVTVLLDLLPEFEAKELEELMISRCQESPKKEFAGAMMGLLPRKLMLYLCGEVGLECVLAGQLPKANRNELVRKIKSFEILVRGTRSIAEATVTRGGVCRDQIDATTMESKVCQGVFFAGEVIDVDGPCGGYNLQIAWSTGALAGKSTAKYCTGDMSNS